MAESTDDLVNGLKSQVKGVIVAALKAKYISLSSHKEYPTGNAYQAIKLGEEAVGGYRHDRSTLFGVFDFNGRKVLDCGCNLGELSRLARKRGAALVDGIEYDHYFVQIARLINAHEGMTRVSVFQGDLTDASVFKDTYDVSMAFSVFPYVFPVLETLAAATREALVLETHNITSDIAQMYVAPLAKYFPYHTFVDYTDFGKGEGKRAVLVFAKRQSTLLGGGILASTVDLGRSKFGFLDAILSLTRTVIPGSARTRGDLERIVASPGESSDEAKMLTGRAYWIEMIKGYLQSRREGSTSIANTYLQFLRRALSRYNFDPALSEQLSSDGAITQRVENQFKDIDRLIEGSNDVGEVEPINVINPKESGGKLEVVHGETGGSVSVDIIDGYHRIFWGSLFGVRKLPALYTYR